MSLQAIVTIPPYAEYITEVARHPLLAGFRLNTVMPIHEEPAVVLARLRKSGKPIWVDLKSRQLRVTEPAIPPFTEIKLSHPIKVNTPVDAFFGDGLECHRVLSVQDNRIILEDGPQRLVGPGESVNILDPSLEIDGLLTQTDIAYLKAMRDLGMNKVMLSYVESPADIQSVKDILPDAEIVLKIESKRGLVFANQYKNTMGQLMAARGDLYIEVLRPHNIINALQSIIQADPNAIVASRIFDSLVHSPVPSSADISDTAYLIKAGYRSFLFGDLICLQKETILEGLNLLKAIGSQLI